MPLLFACRDRNRRRSAAFWLDTRYTAWPRALKNTAIGSHAGPVGSITTSSRVPCAPRPTPPARSTSDSPRSVRNAAGTPPAPSRQGPAPCGADAIPRSIPTSRRCLSTVAPSPNQPLAPAGREGRRTSRPRSQGGRARQRLPLMCCKRARPHRAGPLPSSGASVARPAVAIKRHGALPQTRTQRHPPDQPGCSCNPGTPRRSSTESLT